MYYVCVIQHKLKKTREQVLDITTEMVGYARSLCEDVEFSAEDALRSGNIPSIYLELMIQVPLTFPILNYPLFVFPLK